MKVKDYFDNFAKTIDSLTWDVGTAPWADWAWHIVEEEIGKAQDCFIVDLGSGTGRGILNLLRFTQNARFLGVDFSEKMIERACQKNYHGAVVDFQVKRIDRLNLLPNSVDHFISSGTFHHIKNKWRVLQNISLMLRPGGKFINIDHFRPKIQYITEMQELRRLDPEAAAENDRVRQRFQWIYNQDKSHPREFHTDPYEFADLLKDTGLIQATVHVSMQPGFAVVVGCKPIYRRV